VYIDLYYNKDVYSANSNLEVKCWGKTRAFILTKDGDVAFQNILPTAELMFGKGWRHSSCR